MKHVHAKQHGFSLIEVLVAVLVFSLGLIGLAGLLVMSTQANQGSFVRTHVNFLAQNMADRMRANQAGVWANAYNVSISPPPGSIPGCPLASPCSPSQMAAHDVAQWGALLAQHLPADSALAATIACARPAGAPTTTILDFAQKPVPYDGVCNMTITWTERSLTLGQAAGTQTFNWVFQP